MSTAARSASKSALSGRFKPHWYAVLTAIFAIALMIRLYGVFTLGFGYDGPDSFRVINYDEASGCRSLQGGRSYYTFVGYQILFIQKLMGEGPSPEHTGEPHWRKFCHSRSSLVVHRIYSAVTGSLSVVLLGVLALLMWPDRPQIAWTACVMLGLSNMHVAHSSHFGTVDAPQLFFVGLLTVTLAYAIVSERRWPLWISPLLLLAAVLTKSYVFAVFAFVPLLPDLKLGRYWMWYMTALVGFCILVLMIVGQETIERTIGKHWYLVWGTETNRFGTGYSHIGTWRRWIRNGINLPVVHIVGIGLPAFVAAVYGIKRALKTRLEKPLEWRLWLLQTPAVAYFFYMLLLAPPTYYRYYLPLFPTVALLAAYGFWESRWASKKLIVALFLLYPGLLTLDSEYNYANDPRRNIAPWLDQTLLGRKTKLMGTYYCDGPEGVKRTMFSPELYEEHGATYLRAAEYLLLSESWYDTAFSSELNGPFGWKPEWNIKTTPQASRV